MSTIKTTNIQHPSAASPSIVLASTGNATYAGAHDFTAATVTGAGGLRLVTPTSIANSGGSATATGGQVTFSGVTSVSLNGVFSSTYQFYRVMMYVTSAALVPNIQIRLRNVSDDSSANYSYQYIDGRGTTLSTSGLASQTSGTIYPVNSAGGWSIMDIYKPFEAQRTNYMNTTGFDSGIVALYTGTHNVASSFNGFSLIPSLSTVSGVIRVYGYQNS